MENLNKLHFNHLKIHTQYSICEGAIQIDTLSEYCKKNKVLSIGLSDTSNLSGALDFSEKISKSGSQPIIGSQIKFKFKDKIGLIPLLAKNVDGYKNLIEISSKSFLNNKGIDEPHCDWEDLFLYKDGIGSDITPAMISVVNSAVSKSYDEKKQISWMEIYLIKQILKI